MSLFSRSVLRVVLSGLVCGSLTGVLAVSTVEAAESASVPQGDIAYVLITFNDRPNPPFYDVEWAKRELLGRHAAWLNEISYGRVGPNAKVFGWYRLDAPARQYCSFTPKFVKAVIDAVDKDIDFRQYGIIEVIVDPAPGCGPSNGHTGSPNLTSTKEGKKWLWWGYWSNIFPDAHEFGHDMGFAHGGFIDCGLVPLLADRSLCRDQSYGDRFDPMGGAQIGLAHFNVSRKVRLGFVTPAELTTVTRSGTYTMNVMESPGSAVKGLRIMSSLGNAIFWVEYRQPVGRDSQFPASLLDGAMVRVPWGLSGSVDNVGSDSSIVDCTPTAAERGTYRTNVVCRVGNSITDPYYGVTMTVLSRTATALTVRVDYDQPDRTMSADMVVESVQLTPGVPVAGKPLSFLAASLNQGAHAAFDVTGRLRIDRDNNNSWDVDSVSALVVPAMYPGYTAEHKWSQVWKPTPGFHRYELCVSGQYLEYDGFNDCVGGTFVVADPQGTSSSTPELSIEAMGFSRTPPLAGVEATFSATARNSGGAQAGAQQLRLTIDEGDDGSIDAGPIDFPMAALSSKAKASAKWQEVWSPPAGRHRVTVCVDAGNAVAESNENNNCVWRTFVVPEL